MVSLTRKQLIPVLAKLDLETDYIIVGKRMAMEK
jgi:hypothetical protein